MKCLHQERSLHERAQECRTMVTDDGDGEPGNTTVSNRGGDGANSSAQGVSERFRAATAELELANADDVALLPTRLALAARDVLGSAGAGMSVMSQAFRVPLGATDDDAVALERLQFTTEQGPCWDAIHADAPLAADDADIERRWPQFAHALRSTTGYRSVVSVPLRLARGAGGAADLWFDDGAAAGRFDLDDATVVAAHIADLLNRADALARALSPNRADDDLGPAWARGPMAQSRLMVWIAVGMVINETSYPPADGVALLRAAAYSAGRSVDDVAADVVEGRVTVADLLSA